MHETPDPPDPPDPPDRSAPAIGYLPIHLTSSTDAAARRRIVRLAEDAGLDHLALGDHVSFHVGAGFDGLVGAANVLATSDRLCANTGVYLLPLRHPVLVARQLADLAGMAPGRFVFGVGLGGEDPHELEICGIDPATRGRRMDECLRVVHALLDGTPVDFDGEFYALDQARIEPAPIRRIPILVGGRSDAALRRAGRLGDGWFGIWVSARRYAEALALMEDAARDAGRRPRTWTNALNVWCGVGATAQQARAFVASAMQDYYRMPYERFERWSPAGTPEQIAAFLVPYVEAGCSLFNLILAGDGAETEVAAVDEVRQLVLDATA